MILYMTGHPFIDIGLVTLASIAGIHRLDDMTEQHLRLAAEKLKSWYSTHGAARNYISTVFPNSHFTQPSMSQEQRETYADRYLFAFTKDHIAVAEERRCTYFPELAAIETAYRQHIPLLNGENIGNFSPYGHDGLPVSGLALLAVHALPFGCLKCGGRLLGFHQQTPSTSNSQADRIMFALIRNIWQQNLRILALPADEKKWPDFGGRAKPRYVSEIIRVQQSVLLRGGKSDLDYITGYYFSNYGAGAEIEILHLDHTVTRFIEIALLEAKDAWEQAVSRNWDKGKKGELEDTDEERLANGRRNRLYEQLFTLPNGVIAFLSSLKRASNWKLITIFLKEVLLMEQKRIDTYKKLGDLLTDYALQYENQPHSFYYAFSRAKNYTALRGVIQSAALKMYKSGTDHVLFTFDDFVLAFEHPSERYSQWRLARDLISIRMLELLHQNKIDLSELQDEKIDLTLLNQEEETA